MADHKHPSHVTRFSVDASSYDEICVNCGAHDELMTWGDLARPCPRTSDSHETVADGARRVTSGQIRALKSGAPSDA